MRHYLEEFAKGGNMRIGSLVRHKQDGVIGIVTAVWETRIVFIAHGKPWTFEEMNSFLIKPKNWIKGTKMSFAGLKNAKDRAAVILYMNENTDNPLPLQ